MSFLSGFMGKSSQNGSPAPTLYNTAVAGTEATPSAPQMNTVDSTSQSVSEQCKDDDIACVAKKAKDLFERLYGKSKYFAFRMPLNFKKEFKTSNRICYNSAGIAGDKPHHEISDIQRSWWLVEKTNVPEEYKILYSYTPCNYYHTVNYKSSYFKPPWMTTSSGVSYNDSDDPEHIILVPKPKPGSKATDPPKIKIPWSSALHCLQPMESNIEEIFEKKSSMLAGGAIRKSKRRHFNPRRTKTYKRKNIKK